MIYCFKKKTGMQASIAVLKGNIFFVFYYILAAGKTICHFRQHIRDFKEIFSFRHDFAVQLSEKQTVYHT